MNEIQKMEDSSFLCSLFETKINGLAHKIKAENPSYYVESKILYEAYYIFLEMFISIFDGGFDSDEEMHFKKYFISEKMRIIDKLMEKDLKI